MKTMKNIIANFVRGGGRTLSYLLAAGLTFAAAQSAQAGWAWEGAGADTHWETGANWDKSADNSNGTGGYFRNGATHGSDTISVSNYNVSWASANTFDFPLFVDSGSTLENPWTFSADGDPSYGHTGNGALNVGTTGSTGTGASGWGDGYLSILSGTFKFNGASIGQNTANPTSKGWLRLGSGVSFTSTTGFTLYNGDVVIDGATWTQTAGAIHFGRANYSTTTVTNNGGSITSVDDMYLGYGTGANVEAASNSGDWTVRKLSLAAANDANVSFAFANGTLSASGNLELGGGQRSQAALSVKDGSLTVGGNISIGNGNGTGTSATLAMTNVASASANRLCINKGTVIFNGGSFTIGSTGYSYIGYGSNDAYFEIAGGDVTLPGGQYITVGENNLGTMTVKAGGSFTSTGGSAWSILIGRNKPGVLNVEGGKVTLNRLNFCYKSGSGGSEANITDGGVVEAKCIYVEQDNEAATLNIDGGKLKAREANTAFIPNKANLTVAAGDSGAEFDTSGYAITIAGAIGDKTGEAGVVKFSGGGTVTLSGEVNWTGGTVIELGTKVVATTEAEKNAVLANLVADGRVKLKAADYTVLEYADGGLTDADLANIAFRNCGAGTTAKIVDGTKVVVTLVSLPCIGTAPVLVWPDTALDDIAYGSTFTARMCGGSMGEQFNAMDSGVGYNKKLYQDNSGSVTNIVVEFQIYEKDASNREYIKCVVASFTNGEGGVYAKALGAAYIRGTNLGYAFYPGTFNGTLATTPTASGYGISDLRVTIEEATQWILDQDRTWSGLRNGATLAADSAVRIIVAGDSPTLTIDENMDVAKIEFVNARGSDTSTNAVVVSGGVSANYGSLELGANVCLVANGLDSATVAIGKYSTLLYNSGDTICASASGEGNIEVAPGTTIYADGDVAAAYILNNGTVVKRVAADVKLPFHNASKGVYVVSNGTLKVSSYTSVSGNPYAFITDENPHANQLIDVKSGATYDVNGFGNVTAAVRLESGARIANYGADVGTSQAQTTQLFIDGDATATATGNFGLLAPGYKEARLQLGSHTLTLDGSKYFYLCNTTISGDGTIAVENGRLWTVSSASTGADCTVSIGSNGTMDLGSNFTVKNFVNGGSILGVNTLTVTGSLTPGSAALPKLTLSNGATVKASASAAQTVSTTFNASGTITIDASAITSADLRNATDGRIPVLTVPSVPSGVTWALSNDPLSSSTLSWDGNTLYLRRIRGMMITVR